MLVLFIHFNMKAVAKRLLDVLFSFAALVILFPLFAVIAIAIKLLSAGPVFYCQQRIGRGGQVFWLFKFRTMRIADDGPHVTIKGDQRITRVGRILRRWKLDELPQLWNILRGEMSLVGPRPELEGFVRHYSPEQKRLLEQTPGLASMSQLVYPHEAELLSQHSNPEEIYIQQLMPKKIMVDLEYERVRTCWSDLQLLAELSLLIMGKSYRIDHTVRTTPSGEASLVGRQNVSRPNS